MTKPTKITQLSQFLHIDSYQIELNIDRLGLCYQGKVKIDATCQIDQEYLQLHAKDLEINDVNISIDYLEFTPANYNLIPADDLIQILNPTKLEFKKDQKVILEINFSRKISNKLQGLYPCNYQTLSGETSWLLATQMESHYAREVFVCLDEPNAKSKFDLTVIHHPADQCLSNTPIIETELISEDKQRTRFAQTPTMSTYLLALVIGDLRYLETISDSGVKIRTYATPDKIKQTKFSLEIAKKVLDLYERFFEIPYPLTKLDMVALPEFESGAMENWGLITYREACLIYDPDSTNVFVEQFIVEVIAHEIAHQWFGNLVTMDWWEDLWLNEGFASWMAIYAADQIYPEWNYFEQFVGLERRNAMELDSLSDSHPIEVEINHPDQIRTAFDQISYGKGASIIHMLAHYLGLEIFRKGIVLYLNQYSYNNATTKQLWDALEQVSSQPITDLMPNWTEQSGFPVLSIEVNKDTMTLKQTQFSYQEENNHKIWSIPLNFSDQSYNQLLIGQQTEIQLSSPSELPPLINPNQVGFYLIKPDKTYQDSLNSRLQGNQLSNLDIQAIILDHLMLSLKGDRSIINLLDTLETVANSSTSFLVWSAISEVISELRINFYPDKSQFVPLSNWIQKLIKMPLGQIDWRPTPEEPKNLTQLRTLLLGLGLIYNYQPTTDWLTQLPILSHPDLDRLSLKAKLKAQPAKFQAELLDLYSKELNQQKISDYISALSSQPELSQFDQLWQFTMSDNVRKQDIRSWLTNLGSNLSLQSVYLDKLFSDYQQVINKLDGKEPIARIFNQIGRYFANSDSYKLFKDFADQDNPAIQRSYDQLIETIELRLAFQDREQTKVLNYFNQIETNNG
ncbi:M1 family metallopeptidase [Candidatus Saccharibacteria bacterium]|nr:M1 family metallopeptidase [Candidatus Saccharibacteria bacterium]